MHNIRTLPQNVDHIRLNKALSLTNSFIEFTTGTQFDDDVQEPGGVEGVFQSQNVWVAQFLHNFDFVADPLEVPHLVLRNFFHCHSLTVTLANSTAYPPVRTGPQFNAKGVVCSNITGAARDRPRVAIPP